MCSGRSAEELSSARKALTFAKGPCNKARNSQQANPDVGIYKPWEADRDGTGPLVWEWFRSVRGKKCSWAGMLHCRDEMVEAIRVGGTACSWLAPTAGRGARGWI